MNGKRTYMAVRNTFDNVPKCTWQKLRYEGGIEADTLRDELVIDYVDRTEDRG